MRKESFIFPEKASKIVPYPQSTGSKRGGMAMTARERMLAIRILEKIGKNPEYAALFQLEIPQWAKNKNQEDDNNV